MPTLETLERFISRVEENAHVQAIQEFYGDRASMQENNAPPRVGRDTLVAHEAAALARASSVRSTCVQPFFLNGDHAVIRWIFEFTWKDGSTSRIEELAWQRWEGEKIAQEQFFYDPRQFAAKPAAWRRPRAASLSRRRQPPQAAQAGGQDHPGLQGEAGQRQPQAGWLAP
jgi:hypothetical protein